MSDELKPKWLTRKWDEPVAIQSSRVVEVSDGPPLSPVALRSGEPIGVEDALRAEIAAMKEVVRAADAMRFVPAGEYNEIVAAYDAARAKVDVHD